MTTKITSAQLYILAATLETTTENVFQRAYEWRYDDHHSACVEKDHVAWVKDGCIPKYVEEYNTHCINEWQYESLSL